MRARLTHVYTRIFEVLDTNGNGTLNYQEIQVRERSESGREGGMRAPPPPHPPPPPPPPPRRGPPRRPRATGGDIAFEMGKPKLSPLKTEYGLLLPLSLLHRRHLHHNHPLLLKIGSSISPRPKQLQQAFSLQQRQIQWQLRTQRLYSAASTTAYGRFVDFWHFSRHLVLG